MIKKVGHCIEFLKLLIRNSTTANQHNHLWSWMNYGDENQQDISLLNIQWRAFLWYLPPSLSIVHMVTSCSPCANKHGILRQRSCLEYWRHSLNATVIFTSLGNGLTNSHCFQMSLQKAYLSFDRFSQPLQALLLSKILAARLQFFWRKSSHTTYTPVGTLL